VIVCRRRGCRFTLTGRNAIHPIGAMPAGDRRARLRAVDNGLGARFWLWLVGVCIAVGIGAMLVFLLIGAAMYRWGALGALLFVGLILLVIGFIYDRRQERRDRELMA
jgi:4-hydroxybenzoate polyprenyltransferase